MLLLAFMGFLPVDPELSPSPDPLHLDRDAAVQLRLGLRPDWAAFRGRWGGEWYAVWDPRNASPRFLYAPGVPMRYAEALVADVAELARVDEADLVFDRVRVNGDRELWRYRRTWQGVPVEGDEIGLVSVRDRIVGVWVRLTPLGGLRESPLPGEHVIALPGRGLPALAREVRTAERVSWVGRDGVELVAWDPRRFATVSQTWEERTVGDPILTGAARGVTVTDASGATAETDSTGYHALSGTVTVELEGTELRVLDNGAELSLSGDADLTIDADTDVPYAAANVLHHFWVVRDWLGSRWPTHSWLGDQVRATVRASGYCNAYYTGGTLTFYGEYPGYCEDLGRIADVVYHEYGHGVHDYILAMGTFAGDVSEGSADFVSATILNDPVLAPDAWGEGSYIRELDTDRFYPTDVNGEVHNDGLIWGSFLWNLRAQWMAAYGDEAGAELTDILFLATLEQGPTLTDLAEAVLVADEDDGDWSNGTPHACELKDLLDYHGLGTGPIGVVQFDHTALGPQSSWAESYPVEFDLYDLTPDCSGLDRDSVKLWYTVGDNPVPGTVVTVPEVDTGADTAADSGDTGGGTSEVVTDYSAWTSLPLTRSDRTWTGEIPRQLAGSRVRYFMEAASTDGTQIVSTHTGEDALAWEFWVGDRRVIWCEDFESGAPDWVTSAGGYGNTDPPPQFTDEWQVGTPTGGGDWDADAPWEGTGVLATVIDGDYGANNRQWAMGPEVDATGHGPMLLLTQARWLTVEDGIYDQAQMYVNDTVVYSNVVSEGGVSHTLDLGWTRQDIAAETLLDAKGHLQVGYSLRSDPGLEFGGWAVDEVCLVDLDDVPGHYRVRDLEASDDAETVTVRWTQPWIEPLTETVLVRRWDAPPTGPTDGEVLYQDLAPVAGTAMEVVDPGPVEGETAWYAVFAANGDFVTDVVEGENLDQGGVPLPPPPDTGDTGDTAPGDTALTDSEPTTGEDSAPGEDPPPAEKPEDPAGCGCASSGAAAAPAGLLLGLALLARRRR